MKAAAIRLVTSCGSLSPDGAALILAIGFVLGTFPVYGCPTLFCLLAAFVLRLNLPALQVVNQLTSPLQFALLVPFARLGARIVPSPAAAPAAWKVAAAAMQAITGWFVVCVPLGFLLYAAMRVWPLAVPCPPRASARNHERKRVAAAVHNKPKKPSTEPRA